MEENFMFCVKNRLISMYMKFLSILYRAFIMPNKYLFKNN